MCIRGLDYCPPVDITFGEYLRAILTADQQVTFDKNLAEMKARMESRRNGSS